MGKLYRLSDSFPILGVEFTHLPSTFTIFSEFASEHFCVQVTVILPISDNVNFPKQIEII